MTSDLNAFGVGYPKPMEGYWIEKAKGLASEPLAHFPSVVSQLSHLFTQQRSGFLGDYFSKESYSAAYGLYFFPKNWIRVQYALKEALELSAWRPCQKKIRVLDLGCGAGAAGLATLQLLGQLPITWAELHAVDRSRAALNALREVYQQTYTLCHPRTHLHTYAKNLLEALTLFSAKSFDLILLSFSLNELNWAGDGASVEAYLTQLRRLLQPWGLLLVVEPAQREAAEALRSCSDHLIQEGVFHNWGPYLHSAPCPLLQPSGRFWTHEVRNWAPNDSLLRLSQKLGRNLHELKFSYSLLGRSPRVGWEADPGFFRLVSPISRMKGAYLASGVASDGNVHVYDFQHRDFSSSDRAWIRGLQRGDVLKVQTLKDHQQPRFHRVNRMEDLTLRYTCRCPTYAVVPPAGLGCVELGELPQRPTKKRIVSTQPVRPSQNPLLPYAF